MPTVFAFSRCLRLFPDRVSSPSLVKPDVRISRMRLANENMPSLTAGISSSTPDVPEHTREAIRRLRNIRISESSPCASEHATFASDQSLPPKVSVAIAQFFLIYTNYPKSRDKMLLSQLHSDQSFLQAFFSSFNGGIIYTGRIAVNIIAVGPCS